MNTLCSPCLPVCSNPFDRVVVSYLLRGNTRVLWSLKPTFTDPLPFVFTLQVSQAKNPEADDWEDVGTSVTNQYAAVDGEQRLFGKIRWLFYRVQLVTNTGIYYSDPTGLEGTLPRRDWRVARELMRQELLRMRQYAGQQGYLLKRRITGTPCPVCLDPLTNEIRDPYCPTCWGTGFYCGYFFPVDCVWADIEPKTYHVQQTKTRGTTADIVVRARMLNTWMMSEEDVWVNKVTDDRYYVHTVQHVAEIRGVPIAANVELRPAAVSDPVYGIEIPNQLLEYTELARRA